MDNKDILKSMLNSLINDNKEQASMDLHNYLSNKMKDVAGTVPQDSTEYGSNSAD